MTKQKKESFFWTSYSDLMTSLFFVMLVLFVLTIALLHKRMVEIDQERKATQAELDKIKEIEVATHNLDSNYFTYNELYKKHILKIAVRFDLGSSDMRKVDVMTKTELKYAGISIQNFISEHKKDGVQYMVIIEGQASYYNDGYRYNYELSYSRALALKKFWEGEHVCFDENCEVLVSGSGDGQLCNTGIMRETDETKNQRFLVHIVPKYGVINTQNNRK